MKKLLVTVVLAASVAAHAQTAIGIDAPTCGKWVGSPRVEYRWWFIGFLSGLNSAARADLKVDPLTKFDLEGSYLWIDNYCRANPLSNVVEASMRLYVELSRVKNAQ